MPKLYKKKEYEAAVPPILLSRDDTDRRSGRLGWPEHELMELPVVEMDLPNWRSLLNDHREATDAVSFTSRTLNAVCRDWRAVRWLLDRLDAARKSRRHRLDRGRRRRISSLGATPTRALQGRGQAEAGVRASMAAISLFVQACVLDSEIEPRLVEDFEAKQDSLGHGWLVVTHGREIIVERDIYEVDQDSYHHTFTTNAARKLGNPFLRAKPRTRIVLMLPELDTDTHESSGAAAVARAFARRYGRVALNDHAVGEATYRS